MEINLELRRGANMSMKSGLGLAAGLALTLICIILCAPCAKAASVRPAAVHPALKEPTRYAFIVGNDAYDEHNSSFGSLKTSCKDAKDIRAALINAGWKKENIFPKVSVTGTKESDNDIENSICNLTTQQLQFQLTNFVNKRAQSDENYYALIYYSGHGAEDLENQYIFGVDARIDPKVEIQRMFKFPNYPLFSGADSRDGHMTGGVNLTGIIKTIDGHKGTAVLAIVNACRDNEVVTTFQENYKRYQQKAIESQDKLESDRFNDFARRLDVNYINSAIGDLNNSLGTTVILFSTRATHISEDQDPSGANNFSKSLVKYLSDSGNLETHIPVFVDDFISVRQDEDQPLQAGDRQIPERMGNVPRKPMFCLKGCAQALGDWPDEKQDLGGSDVKAMNMDYPVAKPRSLAKNGSQRGQLIQRVAYFDGSSQAASADDSSTVSLPAAAPSVAPKEMRIDIFYCAGDEMEAERFALAKSYRDRLEQATPPDFALEDYSRQSPIKIRSLSINRNLADGYRKSGYEVYAETRSKAEVAWGSYLLRQANQKFHVVNPRTPTPNYVSVFFCEGFKFTKPVTTVFAIVPDDTRKADALSILDGIKRGDKRVSYASKVTALSDLADADSVAPDATEVRYFTPLQKEDASTLRQLLQKQLGTTVKLVAGAPDGANIKQNPAVEVWFADDDLRQAR